MEPDPPLIPPASAPPSDCQELTPSGQEDSYDDRLTPLRPLHPEESSDSDDPVDPRGRPPPPLLEVEQPNDGPPTIPTSTCHTYLPYLPTIPTNIPFLHTIPASTPTIPTFLTYPPTYIQYITDLLPKVATYNTYKPRMNAPAPTVPS